MGASLLPMVEKTKLTGSLGHHPNIKECGQYPVTVAPPVGQSSTYPIWKLHTHPHLSRGLSHGDLIAANGGEDKVNWEPRPSYKHQIVWTVPGNC